MNTLVELPPVVPLVVRLQCAALPSGIELFFEDGVSCQERQAVAEGLSAARNYLRTFGRDVGEFSVYAGGLNFLAPAYVERVGGSLAKAHQRLQSSTAQMRRSTVFINTDDEGWGSRRIRQFGHPWLHTRYSTSSR